MSVIELAYKKYVRPKIFMSTFDDAEPAHDWAIKQMLRMQKSRLLTHAARWALCWDHPMLRTEVMGLKFSNPFGLAAGYDKSGQVYHTAVPAMGWGFCEVGSVTRFEQKGNKPVRVLRSEKHGALWNWMGLNGPGAYKLYQAMCDHRAPIPIGLSVAQSTTQAVMSEREVVEDYCGTIRGLWHLPDFIVLNLSCPNVKKNLDFQKPQNLSALLKAVRALNHDHYEMNHQSLPLRPIGVKISPDLPDSQLQDIMDVCLAAKIDFIVAVNTTMRRDGVKGWNIPADRGGISGRPLWPRSIEVVRQIRRMSNKIVIIGVGGIENGDRLFEMIAAGANLCEAFTAWPFEGPDFVKRTLRELVEILKECRFKNVSEAVGIWADK